MLHTIGLFVGVIFTIFAFIRIGYAVGEADFYISTRDNPNIQKLAKAKKAAKVAKKAAKAQAKAPAIDQSAEPTAELPGDRIKATARDILDRMDK